MLTLTVPANAFDFTADDPVTAQVSFADSTTYYAGTINTGTVTAVGLEGIALSGSAQLQFNQSSGTDGGYIDFTADPTALTNPLDTDADNAGLRISTGVSVEQFVDLNFNTEFLRVAGDMTATVDGFVYASGSLALEKKGAGTVSVKPSVGAGAATPQAVDLLTLGGTVDLFAGVNARRTSLRWIRLIPVTPRGCWSRMLSSAWPCSTPAWPIRLIRSSTTVRPTR